MFLAQLCQQDLVPLPRYPFGTSIPMLIAALASNGLWTCRHILTLGHMSVDLSMVCYARNNTYPMQWVYLEVSY
jgi:hypothetical protein